MILKAAAIGGILTMMSAAQAATVTWEFNRPSTSSQNPPYDSVATLTLQDGSDGDGNFVLFTLDPNEANPGYDRNSRKPSTVNDLSFAFTASSDLASTAYEYVSGVIAKSFFGDLSDDNIESGYKSGGGTVQLTWKRGNASDFTVDQTSVWRIRGTTIEDNFSTLATTNSNKPSPIFGVISVDPFSHPNQTPNSSNWVTGPNPVPLPAAAWLFGSAMLGLAGIGYRRKALKAST
ncbi:VPLPA-CTERM sorting domain-containing protein [Thiorhodococcus mannitoliphagus]|uniref:VPLPA-CTERM sorting domain-containing protein n=1 Tax=Thiorhodococcus mannitoliphagus TaxID=329406 RepID=UPI00197D8468